MSSIAATPHSSAGIGSTKNTPRWPYRSSRSSLCVIPAGPSGVMQAIDRMKFSARSTRHGPFASAAEYSVSMVR